jgi:hypothetical protein
MFLSASILLISGIYNSPSINSVVPEANSKNEIAANITIKEKNHPHYVSKKLLSTTFNSAIESVKKFKVSSALVKVFDKLLVK